MKAETRRALLVSLLGVGTFALIAVPVWFFAGRPIRYVDAHGNFSIRFTPEWAIQGAGEGADVRALRELGVAEGSGTGIISVFSGKVAGFADAAVYREWFVEQSSKGLEGYARVRDGRRRIGDAEAPWVEFTHMAGPEKERKRTQCWQVFFLRDKDGFVVTCTARPVDFERFRPDFEAVVDSFRLE